MARILITDDEPSVRSLLATVLGNSGHEVVVAEGGEQALAKLGESSFDLLLCDVRMEPMDGMEVLKSAREMNPDLPVVMMTAHASLGTAVAAWKLHVFDYLTKPLRIQDLISTVEKALEAGLAEGSVTQVHAALDVAFAFPGIVSESKAMKGVCEMIRRVAPTDIHVLLLGEPGTEKDVVAYTIHRLGRRRDGRFLRLDCSEMNEQEMMDALFGQGGPTGEAEGLVRAAAGGTLFVDAAEAMPPSVQARMVDVLDPKRGKGDERGAAGGVRVMTSTTADLPALVAQGAFQGDLHRLVGGITIRIAPLRERREDIIPLALYVLGLVCEEQGQTPRMGADARRALQAYAWPGNVAELEAMIREAGAKAAGEPVTCAHLPPAVAALGATPGVAGAGNASRGRFLREFLQKSAPALAKKS